MVLTGATPKIESILRNMQIDESNPVSDLFEETLISATDPQLILEELGKWGASNLAYGSDVGCNPGLIFRGELNYKIPLWSKLEREIHQKDLLLSNEASIYSSFLEGEGESVAKIAEGKPLSRNEFWWWLSLMQHYRKSTRLIDFTRDIRIALFFALEHFFDKNVTLKSLCSEKALIIFCFPCRDPKHQFDPDNNKSPFKPIPGGTDMNLALGWKVDRKWMALHNGRWQQYYGCKGNKAQSWG